MTLASLFGLAIGTFTLSLSSYPAKLSIILVFGILFMALIVLTGFSRYFILFSLIMSLILFLDYHIINLEKTAPVHGLTVSILDIFLVFLILRKMLFPDRNHLIDRVNNGLSSQSKLLAVILLATFTLSFMDSNDSSLTLFGLIQYVKMVALFFFIANDLNTEFDFSFISWSLTCALALLNIFCMAQFLTKINFTISFQVITMPSWYQGDFSPVGPAGSPNVTAGQIITLLPFCLSVLLRNKNLTFRAFALVTGLSSLICLVLTQSRAAWGVFVLIFGVFLWLVCWKKLMKVRYALLILFIFAIIGGVFFVESLDKMSTNDISDPQNLIARLTLMKTSFQMIQAHPFIGVGLNNYSEVMMEYVPLFLSGEWLYLVHNKYILIWSETGTMGLIIYLLFLISIYRNVITYIRNQREEHSMIGISVFCSLMAFNLHMIFESYSGGAITFQFWLICGLAVALGGYTVKEHHSLTSSRGIS